MKHIITIILILLTTNALGSPHGEYDPDFEDKKRHLTEMRYFVPPEERKIMENEIEHLEGRHNKGKSNPVTWFLDLMGADDPKNSFSEEERHK